MDFNWVERAGGVALVALFLLEFRDPRFRRSWYRDPRRMRRNLAFGAAAIAVLVVLRWINRAVESVSILHLLDVPDSPALELPLCVLVAELAGWFLHWVKHENRFLWGFHFQHHRESEYNLWLTMHTHALEVLVSGVITSVFLSLWGFSVLVIELYLVWYGFMKAFQHSAISYSMSVLGRLVITPAYHRLHHEIGSRSNYGITLTLFDVLFRTARWPAACAATAARYGLDTGEVMPFGFWKEMLYPLSRSGGRREAADGD
jgi:sterol desaturase/sphingolipid hydroxylase (fatty acid hydroxylase superfamily)